METKCNSFMYKKYIYIKIKCNVPAGMILGGSAVYTNTSSLIFVDEVMIICKVSGFSFW